MPADAPGVDPTVADPAATVADPALGDARRVNAACDRFEAAWRAGRSPRIEDEVGDHATPALLIELVALEIELRRERGEAPMADDYRGRFPALSTAALDAALADPDGTIEVGSGPGPIPGNPRVPGSPLAEWDWWATPGDRPDFGDFEILAEVGRGGMGVVYQARKRSLNCLVALKVMRLGPLASDLDRRRFLLEAEAAANLDHPNIVPVHEIDRAGGLFFTMKWVDGGSLAEQVARLVDEPVAAARLVLAVARAVHEAHTQGYLHRDLKPSNILVDPQGRPYVTDFGLATRLGGSSQGTHPGTVLGTPSYMAPEQAAGRGAPVRPTADVYSLGAILYELLAGCPPFRAATMMETLVLVLEAEPVPPSRIRRNVAPELEAITLRALEKAPSNRYPTAQALADDLEAWLRHDPVAAMRAGPVQRARRWTRQEPQLVSRLLALAAFEALTQTNFALYPHPDVPLHLAVSGTLLVWAAVSVALQALDRRDHGSNLICGLWSAADTAFLTLTLWLLDGLSTSLVVSYPLLVAASGLWFRLGLVWFATATATAGYLTLVGLAARAGTLWATNHHPNIVVAAIAVAGFIVARQVRRLLALSSFYEDHRAA